MRVFRFFLSITMVLLLQCSFVHAESETFEVKEYLSKIKHLRSRLSELEILATRAEIETQYSTANEKVLDKADDLEKARPLYNEHPIVFTYMHLNEMSKIKLDVNTGFVNELGRNTVNKYYELNVAQIESEINESVERISSRSADSTIRRNVELFYEIIRRIEELREEPPDSFLTFYEPTRGPDSTEPYMSLKYETFDWINALELLKNEERRLKDLRDKFIVDNMFIPRDQKWIVTLLALIASFMAYLPGYFLTYTRAKPVRLIMLSLVISMLLAVVLIFTSKNTLLNITFSVVVPMGFGAYWVTDELKRRKKEARVSNKGKKPKKRQKKKVKK